MNMKILKSINPSILLSLFVVGFMLLPTFSAEAALPDGRYGWYAPVSAVGGPASCGVGEVEVELELLERNTNASATVSSALLMVKELSDGSISNFIEGSGPLVSSVCYNPSTQGIAIDVSGGINYRNFTASHSFAVVAEAPVDRSTKTTVWLAPRTFTTPEYEPVSPVGGNYLVSPDYTFNLNYLPSLYGATAVSEAKLTIAEFDPLSSTTAVVAEVNRALTGGVGSKTLPAETLPDGMYQWGVDISANGSQSYLPSYNYNNLPKSGFMDYAWPFTLDTTAPTTTNSIFPVAPNELQTVTVRSDATDGLSGINRIRLYVDGALERTCLFINKNSATCTVTVGPFASGSTHDYYTTVEDAAGNILTSATSSFSVVAAALPPALSCATPLSYQSDSAEADGGVEGFGRLGAQFKVGNLLFTGSSLGAHGLYIYDVSDPENIVQRSFYSTELVFASGTGAIHDIDVDGNFAYLAADGGLIVVDISNPDDPNQVFKRAMDRNIKAIDRVGSYLYLATSDSFITIDYTLNASWVEDFMTGESYWSYSLNSYDEYLLPITGAFDMAIDGNYAYLALGIDGFSVIDITDPLTPTEVVTDPDIYSPFVLAYSVAVSNEHLYVSANGSNKIRVYNITNPESPLYLTSVDATAPSGSAPRNLHAENNVLYAAAGRGGVYVFDIGNPSIPTLLYQIDNSLTTVDSYDVWHVLPLDPTDFTKVVAVSLTVSPTLYTMGIVCVPTADLDAGVPTVSVLDALPGETITFRTGNITNRGTAEAGPHNFAGFLVDYDDDGMADYDYPLPRQTSPTAPGDDYEISLDWLVPYSALPGENYRIKYYVDWNNEVEAADAPTITNNASPWSGDFTVGELIPTGDISATNCTIALGESSCESDVNWTSSNFVGAASTRQNGVEFSTETSSSSAVREVNPNNRTFTLLDTGDDFIDGVQPLVNCDTDVSVWDGFSCVPLPPDCPADQFYNFVTGLCTPNPVIDISVTGPSGVLDLSRIWVRTGKTTTLDYTVTANFVTDCTIYDGTVPAYVFTHDGLTDAVTTGQYTTSEAQAAQIIKLSCTSPGMLNPTEFEFRINVVPNVQEG